MSVPKVRLESAQRLPDGTWQLDAAAERHITKSLRLYEGAMIDGLSSEDGMVRSLRLIKRDGSYFLEEVSASKGAARTGVVLLIGMLKSDQFEPALRACAELGVSEIVPAVCERSIPRCAPGDIARKMARWNKIMLEATKVSGAVCPPLLHPPTPFASIDWDALPSSRYAAMLSDRSVPIADAVRPSSGAVIAIGPEGDWTDAEGETLIRERFAPVSLGSFILRASTAAATAAAFLIFTLSSRSKIN